MPRTMLQARWGGVGILLAVATFALGVVLALNTPGTAYVWHLNMISDLGDPACHERGGRWICSPGHGLFNGGLIATGVLLAASGALLLRLWGRLLAGSVVLMGVGLTIAAVFPAGTDDPRHLAGVILALVVPGLGFLVSGIRPETAWLHSNRVLRVVLGVTSLVFAIESRLPHPVVPPGAGEWVMVAGVLLALVIEAARSLRSSAQAAELRP